MHHLHPILTKTPHMAIMQRALYINFMNDAKISGE